MEEVNIKLIYKNYWTNFANVLPFFVKSKAALIKFSHFLNHWFSEAVSIYTDLLLSYAA
jgi:hypothetical protein